jgi:hypothetical protein
MLGIGTFCYGAPVDLEVCPVSAAFWQRSNTSSANRNRYFCATKEPRFIDQSSKK